MQILLCPVWKRKCQKCESQKSLCGKPYCYIWTCPTCVVRLGVLNIQTRFAPFRLLRIDHDMLNDSLGLRCTGVSAGMAFLSITISEGSSPVEISEAVICHRRIDRLENRAVEAEWLYQTITCTLVGSSHLWIETASYEYYRLNFWKGREGKPLLV